jgi:peptidoglycan/xylan/chitin deacetylase (PgdA/CDA1 family)
MKSLYTPPKIVKQFFPQFIWQSSTNKILLTFDDSPNTETTLQLLKKLSNHSIKALFFCVGESSKLNKSLIQEIASEGHIIGNHTYSHRSVMLKPKSIIKKELTKSNEVLEDIIGSKVVYFRPPYGQFDFRTSKIAVEFGLKTVMWTLLTFDYKNDSNIVKFAIENFMQENSIVVMHDSLKSKEIIDNSLDRLTNHCIEKGFEIGEPAECLKYSF